MNTLVIILIFAVSYISPDARERALSNSLNEKLRQQALYDEQIRALRSKIIDLQNALYREKRDSEAKLARARMRNFGYWFIPFALCSVREPKIARLECYDAAVAHRQTQMGIEVTRPIE